jgi:hypothetical protein
LRCGGTNEGEISITKDGISLYTGVYDIADADSFGRACADAWSKLTQEQVRRESSIGALMEHLSGGVLDQLVGAHIMVEKVP